MQDHISQVPMAWTDAMFLPAPPLFSPWGGGHHITAAAGDMCVAQAVESGAAGGLRETQTRPIFAMHVSVYCFLRNPFAKVCLLRVS